jgi:hypothetical protein
MGTPSPIDQFAIVKVAAQSYARRRTAADLLDHAVELLDAATVSVPLASLAATHLARQYLLDTAKQCRATGSKELEKAVWDAVRAQSGEG